MHTSKLKKQKSNICLLRELGPGVKKNTRVESQLLYSRYLWSWLRPSFLAYEIMAPSPVHAEIRWHMWRHFWKVKTNRERELLLSNYSTFCVAYLMTANGQSAKSQLIGKDPDVRKDWGQEEKGVTNDEMVGQPHWLSGHEFEQTLGDGEGQGSLVCCSPWGRKELDMT